MKKTTEERRKRLRARLTQEQRLAIQTYVPIEWRWVASHPWLSTGVPEADPKNQDEAASRLRKFDDYRPPSGAVDLAINLFFWASRSQDRFWAQHAKLCDDAQKKLKEERKKKAEERKEEAKARAAESASRDSLENIGEIYASLQAHLSSLGLANNHVAAPRFRTVADDIEPKTKVDL